MGKGLGGQKNQPFVYTPHKRRGPISAGIKLAPSADQPQTNGLKHTNAQLTIHPENIDCFNKPFCFPEFSSPGPAAILLPGLMGGKDMFVLLLGHVTVIVVHTRTPYATICK